MTRHIRPYAQATEAERRPHLRLVAASSSAPRRDPTPAPSEAIAQASRQPLPTSPEWDAYIAKIDRAARRRRFDPADDLWIPAAVVALILFVGGLAFWAGAAL